MTPKEAAAELPPLTDEQVQKVAALLLMAIESRKDESQ